MRFEPLGVLFGVICGAAGIAGFTWHKLHVPNRKVS